MNHIPKIRQKMSENPDLDFRIHRKSERINNNKAFNNKDLYKEKKIIKNFKKKKNNNTLGSFSIISKGNSQPCHLTSCRQNFMTINTKQKLDNYKKNNALKPNRKRFG